MTRGTSITLSYVLMFGMSTILVTGLVIAGGGFVENQREQVIRQEMTVIGNQLAGNIEQADRLTLASDENDPVVYINETFQQDVTGSTYDVELVDGSPPQLVLNSTRPAVSVRVNVTVRTDVADSQADGGEISAVYDDSQDALVIRSA